MSETKNKDLALERAKSNLNVEQMNSFLGEILFGTKEKHQQMLNLSKFTSYFNSSKN
jgi:hypothetical protein